MPEYAPLWYWVREREHVRIRKDRGDARPWTDDPILSTYRFCNVRREDDRVTVWVRDNIRKPYADHPHLWFMLCIARQINWPPTLSHLMASEAWPATDNADPCPAIARELNEWQARGEKVYTGAYMISAPSTKGTSKQAYIAETVCGGLWARRALFSQWQDATLQRTHELVTRSNGWGQFMAYQAVVDMRFTSLLDHAADRETWAAAGPGTIRGLNRLHGRAIDCRLSQAQALSEMRAIYRVVRNETGVEMDFSDVPNILCETDKYLRVKNREGRPRGLYVAGRGH
ncbi:nucleotide kinase domain-containing protein [Bradyrhizobium sp. LHD-71]|uniref:nucleotide kinase domain-containing protein n=1 Tax=Bradyrhizobium sp. LHD-71 TaxID=3072141 RepID=UPI00280DBF4A|nr:nucleotide kinase domain-containing protein [Bradyrhizobium sp. LHD-71]MDQ8732142.1 putative DNA base hypermodification protein [Bradyrhizobium sp. LHD-71]